MDKYIILVYLLRLPQFHLDNDSLGERKILLEPLARAISETAKTKEESAALISQTWHESKLARYVLTGNCELMPKGMQCDNGKARGPFQVWHYCKPAWKYPENSYESYKASAVCTVSILCFFCVARSRM